MTPGMQCPSCKVDLVMTERQNIEIDYCPKCRGVWLDRGELDKILERGAQQPVPVAPPAAHTPPGPAHPGRYYDDDDYKKRGYRRKHWLAEIFD